MNEKEKATVTAAPQSNGKVTQSKLELQILSALKAGQYSAIEINQLFHTGDSRKYISTLRSKGHPISDFWVKIEFTRHKIYFLKGGEL